MQTFLPLPSFRASAACLDYKRLGKQRVENLQIMTALVKEKGWMHHPATKMWIGHRWALLQYQRAICERWTEEFGYKDTCLASTISLYNTQRNDPFDQDLPPWFGNEAFHLSHQSNLVRKNPLHYRRFFPDVPDNLPYIWPTSLFQENNMQQIDNLIVENAELLFRNFRGEERQFNSAGDRNFCVKFSPERAAELKAKGWRIKDLKAREEDDEPEAILKVTVNYKKGRPPRIVLVNSRGRIDIGQDELDTLDFLNFKNVDVILNGWWSDMAGGGYSAFLKTAFLTLDEDELDLKYADVPDGNPTTGMTIWTGDAMTANEAEAS